MSVDCGACNVDSSLVSIAIIPSVSSVFVVMCSLVMERPTRSLNDQSSTGIIAFCVLSVTCILVIILNSCWVCGRQLCLLVSLLLCKIPVVITDVDIE